MRALASGLFAAIALAPFFGTAARGHGMEEEEGPRPNVLFISIDDLRPAVGCYGDPVASTPSIDRLAAEGVVFERAYCQQALCAPSRASVLTGLRPDSTQVRGLRGDFRSTVPDVVTLPQHFKDNGYQCVGLGKVYHTGVTDELSWTEPQWTPPTREPRGYALESERRKSYGPAFERAAVEDDAYPDGRLAEHAVATLRRLSGKPFFLAVGFYKPHLPFTAPDRFWSLYDDTKLPRPDHPSPPRKAPSIALGGTRELRAYVGVPQGGPIPEATQRKLVHGYYACVSFIDAQVGKLLDALVELDLDEQTVVVLWSDHGWQLGDHGLWGKRTNFEVATRSPLIVRPPRSSSGRRTDALVELVDLYPTLCELTGLPRPGHLEGLSLAPLLGEPDRPWKQAVFSQHTKLGRKTTGYSVRTDRYRFTRWTDDTTKEVRGVELYDHQSDSGESVNLAGDANKKAVVDELARTLGQGWRRALPDDTHR